MNQVMGRAQTVSVAMSGGHTHVTTLSQSSTGDQVMAPIMAPLIGSCSKSERVQMCYTSLTSCQHLQVVILARVIVDRDQVYLTADGVTKLVNILKSKDETAVILSGEPCSF